MCLRVCHGILGEELFVLQDVDQETFGWDIMKRTAEALDLRSPFQVVVYAQASSRIQSPIQALPLDPEVSETTFCYIVQMLQAPTARLSQDLLAAIACQDVRELCHLLGKGIDLRGPDTERGHISTILASAILADHSSERYAGRPSYCPIPQHGALLTYLLLQSLANPNVLPLTEKPTTMLELAVELGNSHIVQILLEANASVVPVYGALPPLLLAVLHRHRPNVQLLLGAQANPWERVPIGHLHSYSLQWYPHAARNEMFTVVQAAAAQEPHDTVLESLLQRGWCPEENAERPPTVAAANATVLTELATTILQHTVWTFQNVIDRQTRRTDFTTFRWRRILQGLSLPGRNLPQPVAIRQADDLLSQVD